jgi:branched-chain amino acid transport system substrate-binding protein
MTEIASATPRRSTRIATSATALIGAATLVLAGCTATEPATPTGPLTLKIGTALPQTGNLAFLGPGEEAGVGLAVTDINSAGKGITVEVTWGDSGDTDNKAYETEIPRLLDAGVSAIIGAASSGTSLQFIDQVVGAGVIQFSPANTSATFSTYDDKGLYFRTAPSDVLQGDLLGNVIAGDGNQTLGLIVQNDSYGTGLSGFVKEAFTNAGGTVVAEALYNVGDTNFDAQIAEVTAENPDAIALITFEEAKTIVPELIAGGYPADQLYYTDGNIADYSADFTPGLLEGGRGTLPGLDLTTLADFTTRMNENWIANGNADLAGVFAYGPEAYDAVVLLALAALEVGSVEGVDIATKIQEVSGGVEGGTKCTTFAECADIIIAGGQADYDGISGPITMNEVGDPTEASIGVYEYNENNVPVPSE